MAIGRNDDQGLKFRNNLDKKKIESIADILNINDVADDFKEAIKDIISVNKNTNHSTDYPFLLLPVKIETRFIENTLWIRIFPDQIFLDTHVNEITKKEYILGKAFIDKIVFTKKNRFISEEEKELIIKKDIWKEFASSIGSRRASYVFHYIQKHGKPETFHDDPNDFFSEINLNALPTRFIAYAIQGKKLIKKKLGKKIPPDLNIMQSQKTNDDPFMSSNQWVNNLEEAKENGMAICIDGLSQADKKRGFDKIIVLGMGGTDSDQEEKILRKLIDSHHYTTGISFCDPGTPTNNTENLKSGHAESLDDYDNSYEVEIKGPRGFSKIPDASQKHNAQILAKGLGFGDDIEVLRYLSNSGNKTLSYATEMNSFIFPGAGKYFLTDLLNKTTTKDTVKDIEEYFIQFVRALGHFPGLIIDTQPYGILPVTSIQHNDSVHSGWEASSKDVINGKNWKSFDTKLHNILFQLYQLWQKLSIDKNRVPTMSNTSDPDKSLTTILSMEPVSNKVNARPFLSDQFQYWLITAFKDELFKGSFLENTKASVWAKNWYAYETIRKEHSAIYLSNLTGLNKKDICSSNLMKLFAWHDAHEIDVDFDYFASLSLLLTKDKPKEKEKIKRAISFFKGLSALEFINAQTNSKIIGKIMKVNPHLRKNQQKVYIKKEKTAKKIQEIRDVLKNAQLSNINDLKKIENIGENDLNDIMYSLTRVDYPLMLKFFNTASSPQEILECIKPYPAEIQPETDKRKETLSIAHTILEVRSKMPDQKFTDVSQFLDKEIIGLTAIYDILNTFTMKTETQKTDLLFHSTLDLFSHRLDAWISSLAYKRLEAMRSQHKRGIYLGAYGWIENLKPGGRKQKNSEGYIHAPSRGQAAAAAVTYNAYLTNREEKNSPFKTNLDSQRVRKSMQIIEGMRQGQSLGALLGYLFEKSLHEFNLHKYIDEFRAAFPIVNSEKDLPDDEYENEEISMASISPRNVLNGLSLIRWLENNDRKDITKGSDDALQKINHIIDENNGENSVKVRNVIHNLQSDFDAVNDLLLFESVYQTVQGNFERAAGVMDAMAGKNLIPEIESIRTPLLGNSLENRVCLFFPNPSDQEKQTFHSPRSKAAPRLAKWISTLFNSLDKVKFSYTYKVFKLDINQELNDNNKNAFITYLEKIPCLSQEMIEKILEFKENRVIEKLQDLTAIDGIEGSFLNELGRWICTCKDSSDTSFIKLVNINEATQNELMQLSGIESGTAQEIVEKRPYYRIKDLASVTGIHYEQLRRFCTTGSNEIVFSDLQTDPYGNPIPQEVQIQPLDIFYLAAINPGGGETEIEQRIKYWIRREHNLYDDDPIYLNFDKVKDESISFIELVDLSQQIIKLLGKASPIKPNEFILPEENNHSIYQKKDMKTLLDNTEKTFDNLITIAEKLTNPEDMDRQLLAEELLKASLFNMPISIPTGSCKEDLIPKVKMTLAGIEKKKSAYSKHMETAKTHMKAVQKKLKAAQKDEETAKALNNQISRDYSRTMMEIEKALKSLMGKDFVVLHEFTVNEPEPFKKLFYQSELLGGLDENRIRLWIQQAALTQAGVEELESTMLLAETFIQAKPGSPHFYLAVGQLPYIDGNRWLGLTDSERILFSIDHKHAESMNKGIIPDEISTQLETKGRNISKAASIFAVSPSQWKIIDKEIEYLLILNEGKIQIILRQPALNNVSIVSVYCGQPVFSNAWIESDKSVSGLKIDGWIESLPDDSMNTSVAFHYDAPGTQPPQALLLAVPPDRNKKSWEVDDLLQILVDTMDLYKVRAVDFESLGKTEANKYQEPIGAFLPSCIVPLNPNTAGWENLEDHDEITDWLNNQEE